MAPVTLDVSSLQRAPLYQNSVSENGAPSSSLLLLPRLSTGNSGTAWRTGAAVEVWDAMSPLRLPCSRKMTVNNTRVQSATWHLRKWLERGKPISPSQLAPMNAVSISQSQEAIGELVIVSDLLMMLVFAAKSAGPTSAIRPLLQLSSRWFEMVLISFWFAAELDLIVEPQFAAGFLNRQKYVNNLVTESSGSNRSLETNSLQWMRVYSEKLCAKKRRKKHSFNGLLRWFSFWCSFAQQSCFLIIQSWNAKCCQISFFGLRYLTTCSFD